MYSIALRRLPRVTAIVLLAGTVSPALRAQPVDIATRTAARELATQGAEAFERGDYAKALDQLSRANTIHPAPSISVLQARALVHLGRLIEALDRFEETLRAPLPDDAPEAYRAAVRDAAAESDQIRQRIPHLSLQVRQGGVIPKDIAVKLDGKTLPPALLDVDFPADPGDHVVTVSAPRRELVTRRVHLAEKERVVLEITIDEFVATAPTVQQPAPSAERTRHSARPIWGWSMLGGGATALVVSAVTGKNALDKKAHLDSVCRPGCPSNSASDVDLFRSYRTASYVTGGVAVAFVAIGGYLLLSDSQSESTIAVGLQGTQASLWGTF